MLLVALINILGRDNRGDRPTEVLLINAYGERGVLDRPNMRVMRWRNGALSGSDLANEPGLRNSRTYQPGEMPLPTHKTDPEEETCSVTDSSVADDSRNSGIDTYSERNSSTGSDLSELAIHTLLMETRARDVDREVYQYPNSDRYLVPRKTVFDNAADDLETKALSKRSMSLLPQKEVVRPDL